MISLRRLAPLLIWTCLSTACRGGSALPTASKPSPRPTVAIATTEATQPPASPSPAVPTPGPTAAPVVLPSPAGPTTLTGVVSAPAKLITENGAGILANNGGNVISTGGGARRLLAAAAEVPVAGATVRVLDAAGQPVAGADGRPLTALTDAGGRYAFAAGLPARNLVVDVALPGKAGNLQGLAVVGGATRVSDLDLVSTLTTTYILDQYVKGQASPLATLDKLPGDVEASTRASAAAALTAATAVPDALTPASVVATVQQLRSANQAFNDQLEVVKKLLIAAGQSDLGNGLPATQVTLWVRDLAIGPDGLLYFSVQYGGRIWKLTADGQLVAVAGADASAPAASVEGVKALDAAISSAGIAFDLAGRLLLLEYRFEMLDAISVKDTLFRISRLEADGKLHELLPFGPTPDGIDFTQVLAGSQDDVVAVGATGTLWDIVPGKAPAKLPAPTGFRGDACGRGPGNVLQWVDRDVNTQVPHLAGLYDLATGHDLGAAQDLSGKLRASLDKQGNLLSVEADGSLVERSRDGTTRQLMSNYTLPGFARWLKASAVTNDGTAYVTDRDAHLIYRIAGGQRTVVAGQLAVADGTAATLTGFNLPEAATFDAAGNLFVLDGGANKVFKIADGKTTLYAGTGATGPSDGAFDGKPALTSPLYFPRTALQHDDAGNLYYLADAVHRIGADGLLGTVLKLDTGPLSAVWDLAAASDGTLFLGGWGRKEDGQVANFVGRLAPGAQTLELVAGPFPYAQAANMRLALDPKGGLYILGDGTLRHWAPDGGVKTLKQDARFALQSEYLFGTMAVLDPQGRVVFCKENGVVRYDPAADTFTPLAGAGSSHFTGSGVDDSLAKPSSPIFAPNGDLYVVDGGHKQLKRIPAAEL